MRERIPARADCPLCMGAPRRSPAFSARQAVARRAQRSPHDAAGGLCTGWDPSIPQDWPLRAQAVPEPFAVSSCFHVFLIQIHSENASPPPSPKLTCVLLMVYTRNCLVGVALGTPLLAEGLSAWDMNMTRTRHSQEQYYFPQ